MSGINKNKLSNYIIVTLTVATLILISGLCFDYYFDLNDDVLMKDIISGVYSGIPENKNIQMLFGMSAFISLLYRLVPRIPWYGLILCLFQFGSLWVIGVKTLEGLDMAGLMKEKTADLTGVLPDAFEVKGLGLVLKTVFCVAQTFMLYSLMLTHFVIVQYTITVAMMAAGAVSFIFAQDLSSTDKGYIKKNIPVFIIVVLAFLLRSEMLLLMSPFIGLAYVIKWSYEKKLFSFKVIKGYLLVFLILALLLLTSLVTNKLAYSGEGWEEFSSLFDARTKLYDYQVVPLYEGNESFYDSVELSDSEAILFDNYNFGIDPKIDSLIMWKVADYADSRRVESKSFSTRLKEKLRLYIYEISHGKNSTGSDYPFNIVTGFLYILILVLTISSGDYIGLLRPFALFAGRTVIWLYILLGDRSPDRITHSLYLIEISVLLGMLLCLLQMKRTDTVLFKVRHTDGFEENHKAAGPVNNKRIPSMISTQVLLLTLIFTAFVKMTMNPGMHYVQNLEQERKQTNEPYIELYNYMSNYKDNYYLLDVYSTVAYSERMFGPEAYIDKSNSELLGGWFCASPVCNRKLAERGFENMEQALLLDNVYFVRHIDQSMNWLENYYDDKGIAVKIKPVETVQGVFEIYEITRK